MDSFFGSHFLSFFRNLQNNGLKFVDYLKNGVAEETTFKNGLFLPIVNLPDAKEINWRFDVSHIFNFFGKLDDLICIKEADLKQ